MSTILSSLVKTDEDYLLQYLLYGWTIATKPTI
jgi:hypothetical protein